MLTKLRSHWWGNALFLALMTAPVYIPFVLRLTYYRDDWYYAYDGLVGPSGVFRTMFASDRPLRGWFFEVYLYVFGISPFPYHLGMYFWRLAGGLGVTWLVIQLWPRHWQAAFISGLLYAIYPGFTWWVGGLEYQPMAASAALMVFSFGFTYQGLRASRT